MRKKGKDYIITLTKYGFKVEAWDKSEENKADTERTHKAMKEMIKIDKEYGICQGNRDGLD